MTGRALALRKAFDESFARPATPEVESGVDLLGIRVGEASYAIRMSQVAGLRSGLHVTACPTPVTELVGIAGIGGVLVPVYDLAAALGLPPAAGRWTALVEGGALALAFADFAGHFRIDPAAMAPRRDRTGSPHVTDFATFAGHDWSVLDVPSVVSAIRKRLPPVKRKE